MISGPGLKQFIQIERETFTCSKQQNRTLHISEFIRNSGRHSIEDYISDKAPFFYRDLKNIIKSLENGFFLSPIYETLSKLPKNQHFQESHFGEITSGIFAEEVMGLKKIYSKLSLLTAENANAYKMDLILYNPNVSPIEFIFAEAKCSPKTAEEGYPAEHDKSCFPDLFNSLNHYSEDDLDFDLTAAKDKINELSKTEQEILKEALLPYSNVKVKYAGFAIIDSSTKNEDEISVLATRKNEKEFDVDLICIEDFPEVASAVYKKLKRVMKSSK